jgi:xanthine dehydrogenase YagS FAD-binding subunit
MKPFTYQRAGDVGEAISSATDPGAMFLAGGTNLVDLMKLGVARPERLIDVGRLPLDGIDDLPDGGLSVGGGVRNSDLAANRSVRERYPLLAQAILSGASGQVRNLATVAGNLLQRTRCPYFQDISKPCNKRRPGTGCPAREGEHRNLAILGHSEHCVATHPSDMAVALAALDAQVRLEGPRGARTLPVRELHRLPGDHPQNDTVLEPGELITAIELPAPFPRARSAYRKVRDRASFAFALVSVAMVAEASEGVLSNCHIAFGGVAHVPWRAVRAEESLRGQPVGEEAFRRAAQAELEQARPLRENSYKVQLARNLLVRTLAEVTAA